MRCAGFSLRWLLLLWSTGSRRVASVVVAHGLNSCGSRALERRLSSCGARASLLHGMCDLPGPGLEPVSPALADGFLTTAPQGKSLYPISDTLFCPEIKCQGMCQGSGQRPAWEFSLRKDTELTEKGPASNQPLLGSRLCVRL